MGIVRARGCGRSTKRAGVVSITKSDVQRLNPPLRHALLIAMPGTRIWGHSSGSRVGLALKHGIAAGLFTGDAPISCHRRPVSQMMAEQHAPIRWDRYEGSAATVHRWQERRSSNAP